MVKSYRNMAKIRLTKEFNFETAHALRDTMEHVDIFTVIRIDSL